MRLLLPLFVLLCIQSRANDTARRYDPAADVEREVAEALATAKAQRKNVFLQVGGDWCIWCRRLDLFIEKDAGLQGLMQQNFVVRYVNHSTENKNLAYLKKLGFPQRFGFPVIVILDAGGKQLHTQDMSLLRQGNTYSRSQLRSFLQNWSPDAFDERKYKD